MLFRTPHVCYLEEVVIFIYGCVAGVEPIFRAGLES